MTLTTRTPPRWNGPSGRSPRCLAGARGSPSSATCASLATGRKPTTGTLGRLARASNLALVLLFGPAMKAAADEAGNGNVSVFDDKKRLVEFVRGKLAPGDIVLVKGSRALGLDEVVEALV